LATSSAPRTSDTLDGFGTSGRIRAGMPAMSAAFAKIAALLLDDPALPLQLSITELAQRAGTSPATVTRFCRALGYAGYPTLRVRAAAEQGRTSARESWEADIGRAFRPDDPPEQVVRTLLNAHSAALATTAEGVDTALVARVAAAIAGSAHVDIYGIEGSATIARELQARLYRIGVNAHAWGEAHAGLTSAALLEEGTVAIAFSNTGRTDEVIEMLSLAKSSGAYAVAVTSTSSSPLASVADDHLTASAPGEYLQPDDLSAKHAQMFLIDLLYLLVAQIDFPRTSSLLAASAAAVAPHRRPPRYGRAAASERGPR